MCLTLLLRRRRAPIPEPAGVQKILVIRQHNQLGDMLCVVPLLRGFRLAYPSAHITLMASPVNADVMHFSSYIDKLINYDKKAFARNGWFYPLVYLRFLAGLRKERFDITLVPMTVSMSFTSCLLAFLSGAKARVGASMIDGKENPAAAFFTHPVVLDWRNDPHRHQALRNLDSARDLRLPAAELQSEITLTEEELAHGETFVRRARGERKFAIVFHPGAGKIANRWPADRFAITANDLAEAFKALVIITRGPMDEGPVEKMAGALREQPVIIRDRSIREVAGILAHADLVVSNDTGIMHVAAAVGVPVLSLFGPTDPQQWAPVGEEHRFLRSGQDIRSFATEDVVKCAREMLGRKAVW